MRLFFTLFAGLLLCAPLAAQSAAATRTFRDWTVTCELYGGCTAANSISLPAGEAGDLRVELAVSRGNYETHWQIAIVTTPRLPAEDTSFTVAVDGTSFTFSGPEEAGAYAALNRYHLLGPKAQDLMDLLVPGALVEIRFDDSTGAPVRGQISLSGLAAAMLWIDENQERVGSERVAGAPPENEVLVEARAPMPPSESLLAMHAASEACDPYQELPTDGIESFRVDGEYSLHMIPCWAGAYNFGYRFYLEDRDHNVRQLFFAGYSDYLGWTGEAELVNPWYDEVSQHLSMFYKGRGIGDCGSYGLWQWIGGNFKMLEYAHKGDCDGEGEPGDFPVIYRAPGYSGE